MRRITRPGAALAIALAIGTALAPVSARAETGAGGRLAGVQGGIHIVQSSGRILRAPQRIGSVLIADPSIANVQPLSETTLFVMGKARGATELYILDDEENVIVKRGVFVTRSLADLQASSPAFSATAPGK